MSFRAKIAPFLFFVSGFTALVLEVVWARQAGLIFGNTTLAAATVIASFMTGLALGSYFFGKLADARPASALRWYGLLEGGVGLFALVFPFLLRALTPVYRSITQAFADNFPVLSSIRFMLCFLILIIPTTLMGGTLPLLSRFLVGEGERPEKSANRLYAVNLFGAVAGAFSAGFILLGSWGLWTTSAFAACLDILICVVAAGFLARGSFPIPATSGSVIDHPDAEDEDGMPARRTKALILFLMFVHGFGAFVVQIAWTRTMALILGSSTYSFSAVLTTFLAGLGLATYAVSLATKQNFRFSLSMIGFLEMAAGAGILIFIPVFEWLIYFFIRFFPVWTQSVALTFGAKFVFCAVSMVIPTLFIGMVLPAAMSYLRSSKNLGRWVGTTYAMDTLGGVLGSFLAAFFFISHFGINGTLRAAGLIGMAAGLAVAVAASRDAASRGLNAARGAVLSLIPLLFALYPWDPYLFSSGPFMYGIRFREEAALGKGFLQKAMRKSAKLLYYKDGISSTVSVSEYGEPYGARSLSLRVNGKVDASTEGDMETQLSVSYLPLFAHPNPRDVLVIGLGAGFTLDGVTRFDSVRSIECVEIEPAVIEANSFFSTYNHKVLKDPRVKVVKGDGRNHIQFGKRSYDVIISEPSNPWIAGVSGLFSKENYEAALDRLSPGGIYAQWFHSYQMSLDDFIMIMNTFTSVFPRASLHRINEADYLLLGSREEIRFSYERMRRLIEEKRAIREDLLRFSSHRENFVFGTFLFSDRDLRKALTGEGGKINSDDRLFLEYSAPKQLYQHAASGDILKWLYWSKRQDWLPEFEDVGREKILAKPGVLRTLLLLGREAMFLRSFDAALGYLGEVLRAVPDDPVANYLTGRTYEKWKKFAEARVFFEKLSQQKEWEGRLRSIRERLELAQEFKEGSLEKRGVEAYNRLGAYYFAAGDMIETERIMTEAIRLYPDHAKNYSDFAYYLFSWRDVGKGAWVLEKAKKMVPPQDPSLQKAEVLWRNAQRARQGRADYLKKLRGQRENAS